MQADWKHIILLLALCVLGACGSEDMLTLQESVPVQVGFTLSTGESYASRALPGEEGTIEGSGYENYIDIVNQDFRFYIFDENNLFVDELKVLLVVPVDNSEYPSTYYVSAELSEVPPETFKVVVAANWDTYPQTLVKGETTIETVCKASEYDYTQPFVPSASLKIPMYGVRTYTGKTFTPNLSTQLEEIYMLRAMAKIEVRLGEALNGYQLTAARINRFASDGMAAPLGIYDMTSENCVNWESGMNVAVNINTGSTDFPIETEEDQSHVIYLPEYKNTDATYSSTITVTLNGTNYDIYFRDYENGKPTNTPIDIVRNHHYIFTITAVGAGIEVKYTVADWEHVEEHHHWTQNYSYPTYENVVPWSFIANNEDRTQMITTEPTMYYDATNWTTNENNENVLSTGEIKGAFEIGFLMTGPANHNWLPAVHGTETDYAIRVYRKESDGNLTHLSNSSEWIASDCWYKIQLIPKNVNKVGTIFELGISTTLTYIDQTVYLLINGEDAQTIRWPNSGSDARIIEVKQIAQPSNENENNT